MNETKDPKQMKEIAMKLYKSLWRKRKTKERQKQDLLAGIKKKITSEERNTLEQKVGREEIAKVKKLMKKNKAAGIDGLPAQLDYLDEWLELVLNEALKKGEMPRSMRIAVVKLIHKKGDKNKMSMYRPISLLCADYKIIAKILTERMRPVLNSVIDNDQQGFIKGGNISGNLLQVKAMIEYCNEEDIDGAMIFMDFKKAYDRIDRDMMFRTLEKMNFGEDYIKMVKLLYTNAIAKIEVNGELAGDILTGGGVRQGCPLSPFLFICVLENMAITLRENPQLEGIIEPETGLADTISLFADDSNICLRKPAEQLWAAKVTMKKYEDATGSEIHEGKTMILRIGKTKREEMSNKQIQVNYVIAKPDITEKYLGDIIGNDVTEEQRYGPILVKMKKLGDRWDREQLTLYGRALIVNTLMMAMIAYRAAVNGMTDNTHKEILKIVKDFVFRGKIAEQQWQMAIRKIEEGGIGVRDPKCLIDSTRIKLIRDIDRKQGQPWVKWIERKRKKLEEKWEDEEVYKTGKPKKKLKQLNKDCVYESAVKVWHEMGGTTTRNEEGEEEKVIELDDYKTSLDTISSKEAYNHLLKIRFGNIKDKEYRG